MKFAKVAIIRLWTTGLIAALLLVMVATAATADPTVVLQILNASNTNGDNIIVAGENVEVGFSVDLDTEGILDKKDTIQLVQLNDGSVIAAKNRGNTLAGSVTLSVPSTIATQLFVRYVVRDAVDPNNPTSNEVIARAGHPDDSGSTPLITVTDATITELTARVAALEATDPVPGPPGPEGPQGPPGTDTLAALIAAGCQDGDIVRLQDGVWNCIPQNKPKTVFVTSTPYDGNLMEQGMGVDGLTGADNLCQAAANSGIVPPGTYIAWLSTAVKDARDRLPPNEAGYLLPDGVTLVATSKADLLDGQLLAPIFQTEFGEPPCCGSEETFDPWTGTVSTGEKGSLENCKDWTYDQFVDLFGRDIATTGFSQSTGTDWTNHDTAQCDESRPLYCIER